jgi:hypothetical protein
MRCGRFTRCVFFHQTTPDGGECRFGHPAFYRTADGDDDSGWPPVRAADWCGEHEEIE